MPDRISVRELRRHLALYAKGTRPVIIGDRWHGRAILLPLSGFSAYSTKAGFHAIARAQKQINALLAELRKENRA